jgi:Flp pilus assembly protein TadG
VGTPLQQRCSRALGAAVRPGRPFGAARPAVALRRRSLLLRIRLSTPATGSDLGSAAVEFALLMPVFVMLIFGMLTGGFTYSEYSGITQAAREGGRYGATLPFDPTQSSPVTTWLSDVLQATEDAAGSDAALTATNSSICVAYVSGTDPTQTESMTETSGGTPITSSTACWTDNAPPNDDRVQVDIQRDADISIGLADWTVHLNATAITYYDRLPPPS